MTVDEIKKSGKDMLTPAEIAEVLACDPQLIRLAAQSNPAMLGFPVIVVGHRTKIPRKPFLAYIGESCEA